MARHSYPRRSGPARQTTWVGPADQNVVAIASTASGIVASFAPFTGASMHKPTIIRTRGYCTVRPQAFSADIPISGAFGLCVVSDEAFAAGAASIPRPFDDAGWDGWFVWQSFSGTFDVTTDIGRVGFSNTAMNFQIDSKGMRKVSDNETIVLMCESQSGALNIAMHLRLLFKLS